MKEKAVYPFTAIVGQESMKLALILNLINPALGGVLIRGEKGTAKSTAVRGLCALMDEVEVSKGCRFHCRVDEPALLCDACKAKAALEKERYTRRVVELPISATEDRVVGALNMERPSSRAKRSSSRASSRRRTAISSMWTRSTCSMTTSWTSCSIQPPWG